MLPELDVARVRRWVAAKNGETPPEARTKAQVEVDEAAWSSLYSTVSRQFDAPSTGKIAVRVVNHYGDEVMQVYEVVTPSE